MADFFKNLDKYVKDWHILTVLGLLVLGYVIYEYSGRQNLLVSNYQGTTAGQTPSPREVQQNASGSTMASSGSLAGGASATASATTSGGPVGFDSLQNDLNGPAVISNIPSTVANISGANASNQLDPSQLLPVNTNSEWVQSQGVSPGMSGMNFLDQRNLSLKAEPSVLDNSTTWN